MEARLQADAKYVSVIEKLAERQQDWFLVQYGDYCAGALNCIRKAAKAPPLPARTCHEQSTSQDMRSLYQSHPDLGANRYVLATGRDRQIADIRGRFRLLDYSSEKRFASRQGRRLMEREPISSEPAVS